MHFKDRVPKQPPRSGGCVENLPIGVSKLFARVMCSRAKRRFRLGDGLLSVQSRCAHRFWPLSRFGVVRIWVNRPILIPNARRVFVLHREIPPVNRRLEAAAFSKSANQRIALLCESCAYARESEDPCYAIWLSAAKRRSWLRVERAPQFPPNSGG